MRQRVGRFPDLVHFLLAGSGGGGMFGSAPSRSSAPARPVAHAPAPAPAPVVHHAPPAPVAAAPAPAGRPGGFGSTIMEVRRTHIARGGVLGCLLAWRRWTLMAAAERNAGNAQSCCALLPNPTVCCRAWRSVPAAPLRTAPWVRSPARCLAAGLRRRRPPRPPPLRLPLLLRLPQWRVRAGRTAPPSSATLCAACRT